MTAPLPISVCIISGPEAPRIGRTLESIAGWTTEIVVVLNQEVTDGTEEIAGRCGAKVWREPWKGHIAQKNSAAEKASQLWILALDTDEVVSPELRREIERLAADPARFDACAAYSFPRLSWYCGRWIRHGDWYPDRQTRLWRRGRATWGGIDPHDKLIVQGQTGKLRGDLFHFSNESVNRQIQKIISFSDIFVREQQKSGREPGTLHLAVRPVWRFLRAYLFRLGFLDGWQGYYIAWCNAFATATRYAKLKEARAQQSLRQQQQDEHAGRGC